MKAAMGIGLCFIGGVIAYLLGTRLSADALGMATGIVFGVLAGLPAAMLVILTTLRDRRAEDEEMERRHERRQRQIGAQDEYGYGQPPVIIIGAPPSQQWPSPQQQIPGYPTRQLPPARPSRQSGEVDGDDW